MIVRRLRILKRSEDYLTIKSQNWTATSANIIQVVLYGSFVVTGVVVGLLLVSIASFHSDYSSVQLCAGFLTLFYLCVVGYVIRRKYVRTGAWMLIFAYLCVAGFILHAWGVNAPIGILLLGCVIVLTSILIGARYIGFMSVTAVILLICLQVSTELGLSHPDRSMLDNNSTINDIANYSVIFSIFALISWLSGKQTEDSLRRALTAELQLKEEKESLAAKLKERTKSLEEVQAKEMRHLYRFAELGQLTTVILHELANHLSVLTLDIDNLKERHRNSVAINQAKESITYIDTIIEQVRDQIKQSNTIETFKPSAIIKATIMQLEKKLPNARIVFKDIRSNSERKHKILGDPLRLSQVVTILVTNASQANISHPKTAIYVQLGSSEDSITVSIQDFGTGISMATRQKLFQPHSSVKSSGLGIGLYLTKQIIETHFKGRVHLDPSLTFTQFHLHIPLPKQ